MINKYVLSAVFLMLTTTPASHWTYADAAEYSDCFLVTDSELENVRGGFNSGTGLEITFGIEKAVFINGVLQSISRINVQEWGSAQNQILSDKAISNMMVLRQNGVNNSFAPNAVANSQGGLFTFIQNSMDNTVIKNVTQISASLNILNTFRDMNLKSLMNQQLLNAMR